MIELPRGSFFSAACHDSFKALGHPAQIAALHIPVNVNHRLDVVMADHALFGAARKWWPDCPATAEPPRSGLSPEFRPAICKESRLYCGTCEAT